jgi:hypothetical protein
MDLAKAGLIPLAPFTYAIPVAQIGPGTTWIGMQSSTGGSGHISPIAGICPLAYLGVNYLTLTCSVRNSNNIDKVHPADARAESEKS